MEINLKKRVNKNGEFLGQIFQDLLLEIVMLQNDTGIQNALPKKSERARKILFGNLGKIMFPGCDEEK